MTHQAITGARTGGYDKLLAELLAANDEGIDIEVYLAAVNAGISHEELLAISRWADCQLETYIKARTLGQPHMQLLSDQRRSEWRWGQPQGISMAILVDLLEGGASYDEAMAMRLTGVSLTAYLDLRDAGVSHAAVMEAVTLVPTCLPGYMSACNYASHDEIMAVLEVNNQADLVYYGRLRNNGVAHDDALKQSAMSAQ